MVSCSSTIDHKRKGNREDYHSPVLEEVHAICPKGPHGEVKSGYRQRERQDQGHMPLLGSEGRVFWGSQAKVRLVNSNLRSGVLLNPTVVFSKGHVRHTGSGRRWRLLVTKAVG